MTQTLIDEVQTEDGQNARELGKSKNRRHLLESAANAIHKFGVRGTTIAVIQQESGLSRGMINLHFGTKENLLLAVAEDLAGHYSARWHSVAQDESLSPKEKLEGVIRVELSHDVLNERDASIWFAFRSEVVSRPEYRAYIDSRDANFCNMIVEICEALVDEGGYSNGDAQLSANALIALFEGIWTDFHLHSDRFDRKNAERTCLYVAGRLFPKHF